MIVVGVFIALVPMMIVGLCVALAAAIHREEFDQ